MSNVNFNTDNLSAIGGGTLVLTGLLILAMVTACRVYEGLGSVPDFRRAAGQVVLSIFLNAVFYVVPVLAALAAVATDERPSKSGIMFTMILVMGLVVWQIILLGMAVKNLLAALNQRQ